MRAVRQLLLARDGPVDVDIGRAFDLFAGEVYGDDALVPLRRAERFGRDEDLAAGEPLASVDDDVADLPGRVVEIQIARRANVAVARADGVATELSR